MQGDYIMTKKYFKEIFDLYHISIRMYYYFATFPVDDKYIIKAL